MRSVALLVVSSFLLFSCSVQRSYEKTGVGRFEGVLEVRWLEPDRFLFVPNKNDPLSFTTADSTREIKPGAMYTDGGSIPRIFWSVPGYSPWGIAPAYIIHDWLFMAHHCETDGYEDITFSDSYRLMGESIKTLMETDRVPKNESLFFNVVAAVKTPIAKGLWDTGDCNLPEEQLVYGTVGDMKPLLIQKSKEVQLKLQKVENDLRATSDNRLKQQYAGDMLKLQNKLKEVRRISAVISARPLNAPATKLLYTIDMSTIR